MSTSSNENLELQLADQFISQTDRNVFLTGRAGTGKTTFLKNLTRSTEKRMIITAPTGVAAINAGGVTLHSFFQLPLGPFFPNDRGEVGGKRRFYKINKTKTEIIKSLDLLVIDEISMVRADLLDSVDAVLRRIRRNGLPFGGVQLLMIGDLYQLPPIVKREEWQLLSQYYASAYFFSSLSLAKAGFVGIELTKVYRQSDDRFIGILNQIRHNQLDESSIAELKKRHIHEVNAKDTEGYITLTTHNRKAEASNQNRLQALPGKEHTFTAVVEGDFPQQVIPAPESLQLKKGAQVMFLRNENSAEKLYYNGKIGKVTKVSRDSVEVTCPDDAAPVAVEPATWENVKYSLNQTTAKIDADIVGTFKQYPLKLAWAITIHKSQGLTFDKAIIDSEAAFSPGQTYVALSRCRTLTGVVLNSEVPRRGIQIDPAVARFETEMSRQSPPSQQFETAKIVYQQNLLRDCFDFKTTRYHLNQLVRLTTDHSSVVVSPETVDLREVIIEADRDIFEVSRKFSKQLESLFLNGICPESDPQIIDRIGKASVWFQDKLQGTFGPEFKNVSLGTDNLILKQRVSETWRLLLKEITVKLAAIKSLENGFDPNHYLQQVSLAETRAEFPEDRTRQSASSSKSNSPPSNLADALEDWRYHQSETEGIARHQIIHRKTLIKIATALPVNRADLREIKGVGQKTITRYGDDLLEIVREYRQKHGIESPKNKELDTHPATKTTETTVTKTKQTSFDLFKTGLTIAEIAQERGLVETTIEGHLCAFIELGQLDINQFVSKEKQEAIRKQLRLEENTSLNAVKETLGEEFSYGEIKMVRADENRQKD